MPLFTQTACISDSKGQSRFWLVGWLGKLPNEGGSPSISSFAKSKPPKLRGGGQMYVDKCCLQICKIELRWGNSGDKQWEHRGMGPFSTWEMRERLLSAWLCRQMGGSSRLKGKSWKVITRYLVRSFWVSTVEAASEDEQASTVTLQWLLGRRADGLVTWENERHYSAQGRWRLEEQSRENEDDRRSTGEKSRERGWKRKRRVELIGENRGR